MGRRARQRDLLQSIERNKQEALGYARPAYASARQTLGDTNKQVTGMVAPGYERTRGEITRGYSEGRKQIETGLASSQGFYETPEMQGARAELGRRASGQGGLNAEELEAIKAGAREEYGAGARDVMQSANQIRGGSYAPGATAESVGGALSDLAGKRANTIRDIDIQNAQLRRDEQAQAAGQLTAIAQGRASLAERASTAQAGMSVDEAVRVGALSQDELETLMSLADQHGKDIAGLTIEEAAQLANISTGAASASTNATLAYNASRDARVNALISAGAQVASSRR